MAWGYSLSVRYCGTWAARLMTSRLFSPRRWVIIAEKDALIRNDPMPWLPGSNSGRVDSFVSVTGRVWGTGIGMPWAVTTSCTSSSSTMRSIEPATRSHCSDGSGPVSRRKGAPDLSVSSCSSIAGAA